ncbi:MAG: ABC transporter ATP-binding protein [Gammaproteobacteria bacterium]|nr:MAG: ABC transporter ATP-binding protein [Gammaproteobacteria bacterium]RLA57827.1 MAG: ABC transporter ATP-binding protein [Gammaproteobacteria bacterium]
MIEITDLLFKYSGSDFALQVKRLVIDSAEAVAVVGPSGSGKTTLLNLLAGVLLPDEGQVRVGTQQVSTLHDAARRDFRIKQLGMVFQNFELLEYLSVLDNILLPLRIGAGLKVNKAARVRARDLAGHVGIADKLQRYPGQLSQGERQRVAVSRALLLQPSLILADEPTGNLDPSNKTLVLDLLLDYARTHAATLVTVTHDRELLQRFDRVVDFSELNQWQGVT